MKKFVTTCLVLVLVLSLMVLPTSAASDLVVGSTYSQAQELNGSNSTSWGGLPLIKQHLSYQFSKVAEGLKVKISVPSNELELNSLWQINFNPNGAIPSYNQGLFLSVIPKADNKVTFLQHNQKTKLKDDPSAAGVEITLDYLAKTEGQTYFIEFVLPVTFFQVVGVSESFAFGENDKLGYILFAVETAGGTRASSSFSGIGESDWKVSTLQYKQISFEVASNPQTGDVGLIGYAVIALSSLFTKKRKF